MINDIYINEFHQKPVYRIVENELGLLFTKY
jgi:hypothetical protein